MGYVLISVKLTGAEMLRDVGMLLCQVSATEAALGSALRMKARLKLRETLMVDVCRCQWQCGSSGRCQWQFNESTKLQCQIKWKTSMWFRHIPAMCGLLSDSWCRTTSAGWSGWSHCDMVRKVRTCSPTPQDFGIFEFSKPCMTATVFTCVPFPIFRLESPRRPFRVALKGQQIATVVFLLWTCCPEAIVAETKPWVTHRSQVLLSDSGKAICEHLGDSHPQALSAQDVSKLPLVHKSWQFGGLSTKYELNNTWILLWQTCIYCKYL